MSVRKLKAKSEASEEVQRIMARRERIIETARRLFVKLTSTESTWVEEEVRVAFRRAEQFEDAAESLREGVDR